MNALLAYLEKPVSRYIDRWALVALVLLALIVRFHGIAVPAIWYDEAFSVLLARHEPGQIWSITARDVHPPLYYLLLHYWMILWGDGAAAVRVFSAIADVGTVLLCIKLMSLVASRRATWIAALLLALLPISVRYSQEARMYTLLGFWLMGATVALVCWVKDSRQSRSPVIYALLMTAAFYTHYFAALCVLVHWFYWWWGRQGVFNVLLPVRSWLLVNGAIVLLFVPWLPHCIEHLTDRSGLTWIPPVTGQAVLSLIWQFFVMNSWGTQSLLVRAVPLVLVVACAVILVRKDNGPHCFSALLIAYFFIPAVFVALVALFVPVFVPRYLMFAAVGLPLIVSVALDTLQRRSVVILALMAVVVIEMQGLQAVYRQSDGLNGTDLRREFRFDILVTRIKQEARPGDEIVLESLLWYLPFEYYNLTGIQPRFYLRSPPEAFLKGSNGGGYALIAEGLYFNDPSVLNHACRTWWIEIKSFSEAKVVLAQDWEPALTFMDGEIVTYLFTPKVRPAAVANGDQTTITPPPPHSAQNCPPAPSATSANKTPH